MPEQATVTPNDEQQNLSNSPDESEGSEQQDQHESLEGTVTTSTEGGQATDGSQSPFEFKHGALKGKKPEDIELLFDLTADTVKKQQERIRELERQHQAPAAPEPEDTDFFANPQKSVESVVRKTMEEMLKPFREEVGLTRAERVQQQMRESFPDWDSVKPYVDRLAQQFNAPDPNDPGLLTTLYYTAKGMIATNGGGNAPAPSAPTPNREAPVAPTNNAPVPPPQHRPSNAPLPSPRPAQGKARNLTEDEERLRREWGMSKEEYLQLQDANPEDIVKIGGES